MYYTVRSLSPYTEYEFYVIATNNIGRGAPSAPAVVTTGETSNVSFISKIVIYNSARENRNVLCNVDGRTGASLLIGHRP